MCYVHVYNALNLIYKSLIKINKKVTKHDLIMFSVSFFSLSQNFLLFCPYPFLYEMLFSDAVATC